MKKIDYSIIYSKALAKNFPDLSTRKKAEEIMTQYSFNEALRVKTAILKVAGSDLKEIKRCTDAACLDYRDVLSWAEYPAQLKAGFENNDPLLRKQDLKQYRAWIDEIMNVQQNESPDQKPAPRISGRCS